METPPSSPRYYTSLAEADQLRVAGTALAALAEEPAIAEAMAPRKYTPALLLADGAARREAARVAMEAQSGEVAGRLKATASQNVGLEESEALYRPLAATARVVFADDRAALAALGLTGEHGQTYGARLERMRDFAAQAAVLLDRLAEDAGTTKRELAELTAALDEAEGRMSAQDRLASRAQDASADRGEAFRSLRKWMLTMHGHARIVLRGRPQLLEMLGIPRR